MGAAVGRIEAYLADRDDTTALPAISGGTPTAVLRRVLFAAGSFVPLKASA